LAVRYVLMTQLYWRSKEDIHSALYSKTSLLDVNIHILFNVWAILNL